MSERVTDHDLERVLAGQTPANRPDLEAVAASLAAFRAAAHETVPQPNAALRARLDLPTPAGATQVAVSPAGAAARSSMTDTVTVATAQRVERPATRGITRMLEFISGLSLAAKITAGAGALALSLAGVGAAGALPGPLQEAFDSAVTSTVEEETTDEVVEDEVVEEEVVDEGTSEEGAADETLPTGSDEFSDWVKEGAQADDKVGAEFGGAVSEQARELGEEKAAERGEAGDDEAEDEADDETEGEADDVAPVAPGADAKP